MQDDCQHKTRASNSKGLSTENTLLVSDEASRNDITKISLEIKKHCMSDLNNGLNNYMDGSTYIVNGCARRKQ